jgi:hypothetical protein
VHGHNGFTLGVGAKLKSNTVLKYLHEVTALIADKLKGKWMGYCILEQYSTYMENFRSKFHARYGLPGFPSYALSHSQQRCLQNT